MVRHPNSKVRLALLGDVLKLLRQRRRPIDRVLIHPDGTIEIRLSQSDRDSDPHEQSGGWAEYDSATD